MYGKLWVVLGGGGRVAGPGIRRRFRLALLLLLLGPRHGVLEPSEG
ncbi:MAG TPA: hypothetical protein VJ351_00410 [Streptosporangiaceae bacterium]|nr:hypothetical protein [Streptosporangiaceae bacterium]